MGKPTNTLHQPNPIDAVRTLLQTFQAELDTFAELSEAAVALLADLELPLGLVDFSPFAQRAGDEAATRLSAPSAPHQGNGATAAKPLITTRPLSTPELAAQREPAARQPATATATATTPVFTLPRRASSPMPTSTIGASMPDPQTPTPGDQGGAEAAALLATMTMVDTLTAALLDTTTIASPDSTSQFSLGETTLLHPSVNGERLSAAGENGGQPPWPTRLPVEQARPQAIDPLVVNHGQLGQSVLTSPMTGADAGTALTTMALLATVTEALLTKIPEVTGQQAARPVPRLSPTVEPLGANWGGERTDGPAAPSGGRGQTPLTQGPDFTATAPAVGTLPAPNLSPVTEGKWPSAIATSFGEPAASLSAPQLPDAWTLAQLINDVLAEEARRHGVDLS